MKKTTFLITTLFVLPASATTVWRPATNATANAAWDSFTFASEIVGESGSQGIAQAGSGFTASDLVTTILDDYTFPGGLGSNPDTYYIHTGGFSWEASATLNDPATYVRVSYSLLGFGGAAPNPFAQIPTMADATVINSGSYATTTNTVFFTDLALASATTDITATFGDVVFPNFPGSFRSIDSVQLEAFDAVPIPEPGSVLLSSLSLLSLLKRRR